jgi:hypothetical protein
MLVLGTDLRGKSQSQVKSSQSHDFDFFEKTEKSQSHDFDFDLTF